MGSKNGLHLMRVDLTCQLLRLFHKSVALSVRVGFGVLAWLVRWAEHQKRRKKKKPRPDLVACCVQVPQHRYMRSHRTL